MFENQVIWITGASSGIGEVLVDLLAEAGVATTVVARRVERLEALADRAAGLLPAEPLVATLQGIAMHKAGQVRNARAARLGR